MNPPKFDKFKASEKSSLVTHPVFSSIPSELQLLHAVHLQTLSTEDVPKSFHGTTGEVRNLNYQKGPRFC
jgi:hypothetical protein